MNEMEPDLVEQFQTLEILNVITKRGLFNALKQIGPDAAIDVNISDLEIPNSPDVVTFFINTENGEEFVDMAP